MSIRLRPLQPLELEHRTRQLEPIRVPLLEDALQADLVDLNFVDRALIAVTVCSGFENQHPFRPLQGIDVATTPERADHCPQHLNMGRQVPNEHIPVTHNGNPLR